MFKSILLYIVIIFMLIGFIPVHGQPDCCSSVVISVDPSGSSSAEGFNVKLDNRPIGVTDDNGYLSLKLSPILIGTHTISATKNEEEYNLYGENFMQIECIDESNGTECVYPIFPSII